MAPSRKSKSLSKRIPAKLRLKFANAAIHTLSNPTARTIATDLTGAAVGSAAHAVLPGSGIVAGPVGMKAAEMGMNKGLSYAIRQKAKIKAKMKK